MRRLATTVVCLVGEGATAGLGRLAPAANVRVLEPDPAAPPLDRAVEANRAAAGTHRPFFVHDADPLAELAGTWARRFDVGSGAGPAPPGELEVARAAVLQRWRAGSLDLPDFYLLLDPDALGELSRHWYLGVLGGAAPRRVVLAGPSLSASLRRLPAGRWWPPLDQLVADVERAVPDLAGRTEAAPAPTAPDPTAPDPAALRPAAPDPAALRPAAPDPAALRPTVLDSTVPDSTSPDPAVSGPAALHPAASDPGVGSAPTGA